jgi:hypothetical protein
MILSLAGVLFAQSGFANEDYLKLRQQGADFATAKSASELNGTSLRFLAVQRYDGGEDISDLLRGEEIARFFAGPGGNLTDEVFTSIAQRVNVCREIC